MSSPTARRVSAPARVPPPAPERRRRKDGWSDEERVLARMINNDAGDREKIWMAGEFIRAFKEGTGLTLHFRGEDYVLIDRNGDYLQLHKDAIEKLFGIDLKEIELLIPLTYPFLENFSGGQDDTIQFKIPNEILKKPLDGYETTPFRANNVNPRGARSSGGGPRRRMFSRKPRSDQGGAGRHTPSPKGGAGGRDLFGRKRTRRSPKGGAGSSRDSKRSKPESIRMRLRF